MALTADKISWDRNPLEITERQFRVISDQRYAIAYLPAGIHFEVDRLRRDRHELHGELSVRVNGNFPTAKVTDGVVNVGDFNFSSVQARTARAKILADRSGNTSPDWYGLLEEFCTRVIRADRTGPAPIDLKSIPIDEEHERAESWDVLGFPVLQLHPMIIFGDGGGGKSYFAMYIAGTLAQMGTRVLYCDWEFEVSAHRHRFRRLFRPEPEGLMYLRCEKPMIREIEQITKVIREHRIGYVICDSVGYACEGRPEEAERANEYFRAVRALQVGSLHLAHTTKAQEDGKKPEGPIGCHDDQTEVLTQEGWIRHCDVTLAHKVLCFNPETSAYQWDSPTHIHVYDYDGEIVDIKTGSTYAAVTPNHRMIGRAAWSAEHRCGPWSFRTVDDLRKKTFKGSYQIPGAALIPDVPEAVINGGDDEIRLIGWWIAEGSFSDGAFTLCQAEGALEARMKASLERLGFDFWSQTKRPKTRPHELPMCQIRGRGPKSKVFADWLRHNCGVGSANKKLPVSVWNWSNRQKRVLFEALMDGDGNRRPTGRGNYTSVSRQLIDDVHRLVVELGYVSNVCWYPPAKVWHYPRGCVRFCRPQRKTVEVRPYRHFKSRNYQGKVYCLTVPTGAYVTRRGGYACITGNSVFWRNGARSVWFIQGVKENQQEGQFSFGLYHRKNNLGRLLAPRGYTLTFIDKITTVTEASIQEIDELAAQLPALDRIKKFLKGAQGAQTPKAIADELNLPQAIVRATLHKHKSQFHHIGKVWGVKGAGTESF